MPTKKISSVSIRMYCLGTGDCFVLKFKSAATPVFTMLIDCGSCRGKPKDFKLYLENLKKYVNNKIDLLVVTHEHNDHVNGFSKCPDIFSGMDIQNAWMAWTENPDDPDGKADDLIKKRKKMRLALQNAMSEMDNTALESIRQLNGDYYQAAALRNRLAFREGLNTLADINLPAAGEDKDGLAGMKSIKTILKKQNVKTKYLKPGDTVSVAKLPGIKFNILGPPYESESVYRHEKEGKDVYKRKMSFFGNSLAAKAFSDTDKTDIRDKDIAFSEEFIANEIKPSVTTNISGQLKKKEDADSVISSYTDKEFSWRRIDTEWLNSAGSLAIRLNSHINNTSLAFAIESVDSGRVLLFPGDAEFGSWESWHAIKKWNKKGKGEKHLVEDLLNRTVFYKVSHHLSFNGTPTALGINMMESSDLTAMATLDRDRISSRWKGTMPNKKLMQDLMHRCEGKVILMSESEISNAPSTVFDFNRLRKSIYEEGYDEVDKDKLIYKQYTVKL